MFVAKALSVAAILVAGASAEANRCPNLTGRYICQGSLSGRPLDLVLENVALNTYRLEDQIVVRASARGETTVNNSYGTRVITHAICRSGGVLDVELEVQREGSNAVLSFVQKSYIPQARGALNILVTWNDQQSTESAIYKCIRKPF